MSSLSFFEFSRFSRYIVTLSQVDTLAHCSIQLLIHDLIAIRHNLSVTAKTWKNTRMREGGIDAWHISFTDGIYFNAK
jgi:hypothetical protein